MRIPCFRGAALAFCLVICFSGLYTRAVAGQYTYDYVLDKWNERDKVDGFASNLISSDLYTAMTTGLTVVNEHREKLALGLPSDLSEDGWFNARLLRDLLVRSNIILVDDDGIPILDDYDNYIYMDPTDYDGLMLYNGSSLSNVNQAIMDGHVSFMRALGKRNSFVRNNHIAAAGQTIGFGTDAALAAPAPEQQLLQNRFWAGYMYSANNASHNKGIGGYTTRYHGGLIGYDFLTCENITIGGAFAHYGGRFKDNSTVYSKTDILNYAAALYGGYTHPSGVFITGSFGYIYTQNDLNDYRELGTTGFDGWYHRGYGWSRGKFHTNSVMMNVDVGYDIEVTDDLTISPTVGFSWIHTRSNGHTQYYDSQSGLLTGRWDTLLAGAVTNNSGMIPVEVNISYDLYGDDDGVLSITGNIGYALELQNKGPSGDIRYAGLSMIDPVSIVSRDPGRNVLMLGAGGKYVWKQFEFGVGYNFVARNHSTSHTVNASFGVNF